MGIILDIIIVAIIIVTAILSAKRGFVRTAVELVGFIAAVYIAFALSAPASAFVYDKWVEPGIAKGIESTVSESSGAAIEALPDFIENNLDKFGVDGKTLELSLVGDSAKQVADTLCGTVIEPVLTGIFKAVISIILFIALTFVVKILAKLLNKLFSFSLVGTLNKTLGFALGAVKGFIFAAIFCAIVVLIASVAGKGFLIFSPVAVNGSHICNFLTGITGINIFNI